MSVGRLFYLVHTFIRDQAGSQLALPLRTRSVDFSSFLLGDRYLLSKCIRNLVTISGIVILSVAYKELYKEVDLGFHDASLVRY